MLQVTRPIAHELLAQYVKQGQALIQRASLVGDFSDYESWKAARNQWIATTVQALEHVYGGPHEAHEFTSAVTPTATDRRWQQQYATDLDCVKAAIALLVSLQGGLAVAREGDRAMRPTPELAARSAVLAPSPPAAAELERSPIDAAELAPSPIAAAKLSPTPVASAELASAPANGSPLPHASSNAGPESPAGAASARTKHVFVVHGRNERWKQAVSDLLGHAGSHEVTILNEPQQEQRALVEQLEQQVAGSHYAVILLTADDVGGPRLDSEEEPIFSPRARQAVVFELGFLVAALTPSGVCVLYEDGVQLPFEIDGVPYVRLDFAGTWQSKLLLRLRRAGFDYDLNTLAPV
jgi:predicted nucleotide-binding protein